MMDREADTMLNELSGIGDLSSFGKTDPKEIIDAITSGINKIRGKDSSFDPIPIQNVILILGGGYLLYKIITSQMRN